MSDARIRLAGTVVGVRRWVVVAAALAFASPGLADPPAASPAAKDPRPNLLLIVADDLGYSDLGAYGSEIATPNIDALARQGVRFTQFHTSPYCGPTRAMLFSGNNNHVAGVARQGVSELLDHPFPGYENRLSDRVVPFPRLLQQAGYHTYIAGKWHLGLDASSSPRAAGFSRAFTMLDGAGSHFNGEGYTPKGSSYRLDDELVEYPAGRYSTELYTERLIEFIDSNRGDGRPFLAVATYTSPHWPLQVPEAERNRYAGRYDAGYDVMRERRFDALKRAGILPEKATLPPRDASITKWSDLDAATRRRESRKMELYAAMLQNLDDHVGVLIAHLKARGLYENTVVVFMSDNGGANEDFYARGRHSEYLRSKFDNSLDAMGTARSFVSYGPAWAAVSGAPFQKYKSYTRQGGIVAPLIVSGPGVARRGEISPAYLTVMDLAPTFLEWGGAKYPAGGAVKPMLGESLAGFLAGESAAIHDDAYVTALYHGGRAFLRKGRWKLSNLEPPFDETKFELFDVEADPGETRNLARENAAKYDELLEAWRTERERLGILLPEDL